MRAVVYFQTVEESQRLSRKPRYLYQAIVAYNVYKCRVITWNITALNKIKRYCTFSKEVQHRSRYKIWFHSLVIAAST